jgi:hypothetical protein
MTNFSRTALMTCLVIFAGFALLMLMPLSVAANAFGISSRHVQGTILSGAMRDASLGRVRIGDINARLLILPLLTGRMGFSLLRGDAPHAPGVSGAIGSGWNGIFVDKLTATIDGGSIVKGLDGSEIRMESVSFSFANNKCSSATGVVRLSLDDTALGSILRGGMIGNAICRDGVLLLSLLSPSTMERAIVRVKGDGTYQVTFTVNDPSPENAAALGLAGFQPVAGGLRLVRSGKLN